MRVKQAIGLLFAVPFVLIIVAGYAVASAIAVSIYLFVHIFESCR